MRRDKNPLHFRDYNPITVRMLKQLISDIEAYSRATGRKPQMILRAAVGAGWGTWDAWLADSSSPTMKIGDRIRAYMLANPPKTEVSATADAHAPNSEEDAA